MILKLQKYIQAEIIWICVASVYIVIFGAILIGSNSLPYTFDNNESFSAFWHARSFYEFGIANSSGLADEAFSYASAAHPYPYTHAGTSPRLFVYLLFLLGIKTVEAQIAVTIFTVGLFAFWLAYKFLSEAHSRLFAAIACFILMTDYLLFTQWHFGTWQIWKTVYIFGGLYLAHRIAENRQRYPAAAIYAFHIVLFYFEHVFCAYVAATMLLYFLFSTKSFRLALKFGLAQFFGALTSAAILFVQCVAQLGWQDTLTDVYFTFIGRNFAQNPNAFRALAKAFYDTHNIVFWMNIPDAASQRNILAAVRGLFIDYFVHTPPWSLVVVAFVAAELIRRLTPLAKLQPVKSNSLIAGFGILAAASIAVLIFWMLASHPELMFAISPVNYSFPVSSKIAIVGLLLFSPIIFLGFAQSSALGAGRLFGIAAFLTAAFGFILIQPALADGSLLLFWQAALGAFSRYTSVGSFFIAVCLAIAALYAFAPVTQRERSMLAGNPLLYTLAAMAIAYFAIYLVFTGYVRNGYFSRLAPFTIYFSDLLMALGFVAAMNSVRVAATLIDNAYGWRRIAGNFCTIVAVVCISGFTAYWFILQGFLIRKLSPDTISYMSVLTKPPFLGSTFVTNTYGGTVAYFTKNWVYLDQNIGSGIVTLGPDGYHVERNNEYLWFADRLTNHAYERPKYYFATTYKDVPIAFLTDEKTIRKHRAGDIPLVRIAREHRGSYLQPVEVARDPSSSDRWSIIQLDWDFPPFLRKKNGQAAVIVDVTKNASGEYKLRVSYEYAQQDGIGEAGTRISLNGKDLCGGSAEKIVFPPILKGSNEFSVPSAFIGTVSAEVQPATTTKLGPIYHSQALPLGSRTDCQK